MHIMLITTYKQYLKKFQTICRFSNIFLTLYGRLLGIIYKYLLLSVVNDESCISFKQTHIIYLLL